MVLLALVPMMLGSWSGSCHVTKDEIFHLPESFADQLTIAVQDKTLMVTHHVASDPRTDGFLKLFILGPADLSIDDWNLHTFEYTTQPGDTPAGVWKGFTQNHADVDPSGAKFTISDESVVGDDAQVIFHTKAPVTLGADGTLTIHVETNEDQMNHQRGMVFDCTYRK